MLTLNATLAIGDHFRLIGGTEVYTVELVRQCAAAGPVVVGVNQSGTCRATARVCDTAAPWDDDDHDPTGLWAEMGGHAAGLSRPAAPHERRRGARGPEPDDGSNDIAF